MDARAIHEKSKALVKATEAGESPNIILGILNELKTGVVPTEDILRSTKIGVTVNRSKAHKNPQVAQLAGEIVRKWKDDIQKQKSGTPKVHKSTATPPNSASPAPNSKPKPAVSSVPLDKRTWKEDGIKIPSTGQSSRDNCIGLLYNGLAPNSTVSGELICSVAVAIESAAYKILGPEDREPYKLKIRSLFANLKNKSNPGLRVRVVSGEIKPERFVNMSLDELKSEERKAEDKKIEEQNMRDSQVPQAEKSISTQLTCGKCGMKKVSYSQAQTRSADEPMTTFCECMNCGKRWKFS